MNKLSRILFVLFLAALASPAFAAKEKFVRSKPHVNIAACLEKLSKLADAAVASISRDAERWRGLMELHLSSGRPEVAIGLLLPAVQKIRGSASGYVRKINLTADGCIRALLLAEADQADIQRVEETRDAAIRAVEEAAQAAVDSFFDIIP